MAYINRTSDFGFDENWFVGNEIATYFIFKGILFLLPLSLKADIKVRSERSFPCTSLGIFAVVAKITDRF